MSVITIGDVELNVQGFAGFDYPQFGTLIKILSDGSSVDNETLQSAAVPRRQATISGFELDPGEVEVLRGYNATKEIVTFSEDAEVRSVVVLHFTGTRDNARPWIWTYSLTLVDFGSGSGS